MSGYARTMDDILDVDLLAFERGTSNQRAAVVDGVRRSLATGFVYTRHDLSEDLLDSAYGMLADFFSMPQEVKQRFIAPESHGQTGYTGLLVETAASSDVPDWKEMLNWGRELSPGHPLRARYPHRYGRRCSPGVIRSARPVEPVPRPSKTSSVGFCGSCRVHQVP